MANKINQDQLEYLAPGHQYEDTKANIEALAGVTAGAVAFAFDTNELGTYNGVTWDWLGSAGADVDEVNILYVGKHGDDGNDGKNIGSAFLTFGAAVTAASALTPSATNRITIVCKDGGIYTENITGVQYVSIFAPGATLEGWMDVDGDCTVYFFRVVATGNNQELIDKRNNNTSSYVHVDECIGTGFTNVTNFRNAPNNGILLVDVGKVFVGTDGLGFGDQSGGTIGHIHIKHCGDLHLAGNNAVGMSCDANKIVGYIDHILETGTPTGTIGIEVGTTGQVYIASMEIIADTAWSVVAGGILMGFAGNVSGAQTGASNIITPAPSDGLYYGRKDGAWEDLDSVFAYAFGWSANRFNVADAEALGEAVSAQQIQMQSLTAYTTAGTSTAYTLTTLAAPLPLTTEERWHIKFHATAGASPTLDRDGEGAKALMYYDSTGTKVACGSTTIIADMESDVFYDGVDYVVVNIPPASGGGGGKAIYGTGADGAAVLDGVNTFEWATLSGSTYTLIRNIYLTDLTIDNTIILITAGRCIYGTGTLTNNGTIHNNGANASANVAGAGGLGGFLQAGGAGGAGIASGAAAGTGSAAAAVTDLMGGIGGRGAQAWVTGLTQISAISTITWPVLNTGGRGVVDNLPASLLKYFQAASVISPSTGGSGGAKSAVGTALNSGGGGGGGGRILIVFRIIINNTGKVISANGGNGGNSAGTGATAGGGGGGGGGLIQLVYDALTNDGTISTNGGTGGTSISLGTTPLKPVARLTQSAIISGNVVTVTVTNALSKNSLYLLEVYVPSLATPTSIVGLGLTWNLITSVDYNSIAVPTRRVLLYYAYGDPVLVDNSNQVLVTFASSPGQAGATVVQLGNVTGTIVQSATNRVDSATGLTVTLPGAVGSANNAIYGLFARSTGTTPVAGAGFVLITNIAGTVIYASEISYNDLTVDMTHTTAAAVAGIAIEVQANASLESGTNGIDGKVVEFQNT